MMLSAATNLMFTDRHTVCKHLHLQRGVIKTLIREQYIQCLWEEGKKEGWGQRSACHYGRGHISDPHTVSKLKLPGDLGETRKPGPVSKVSESACLGWGPRIHMSNRLQVMLTMLVRGPHFENHRVYTSSHQPTLNPQWKSQTWELRFQCKFRLLPKISILNQLTDVLAEQNHMMKEINKKFKSAASFHFWEGREVLPKNVQVSAGLYLC